MQIKDAYKQSKFQIEFGDRIFREVFWVSEESGSRADRILVTISGDTAIEIGWDGVYKSSYPATADGYHPVRINKDPESRKKYTAKIMAELAQRLT